MGSPLELSALANLRVNMNSKKSQPFSTVMEVRIGDINYGGHMGNQMFIQYFHESRLKYLNNLGFSEMDLGEGLGLILTEVYCRYRGEAFYGDQLTIYLKASEIKRASFKLDYEIINEQKNKLIAQGYSIQASFDYEKRKPSPLPKGFIEKLSAPAI